MATLFFHRCLIFNSAFALVSALPLCADSKVASAAEFDELWSRLARTEATGAHDAMNELIELEDEAVRFLEERMTRRGMDEAVIQKWIGQMNDDLFRRRERASRELARLGVLAEPALMQALKKTSSAEVRSRAAGLLSRLRQPVLSDPGLLRTRRAAYVLKQIGTPSARRLLMHFASTANGPGMREPDEIMREVSPPHPMNEPNPEGTSPLYALHRCIDHKSRVFDVDFHPDGRYVASAGGQCFRGFVRVLEVESGEEVLHFETRLPAVCLAYCPKGKFLATGGGGLYEPGLASVDLWDAETGRSIRSFTGHTQVVYAIAFSPNGRWLVSGSRDGTIRLWDVRSGRECHRFVGHHLAVFDVAFSPDGQYLISCGGGGHSRHQPGELILWEVASGRSIGRLMGHEGPVFSVAFSPDGRTFASGGVDKTLRLWSVRTGEEIAKRNDHRRPIHGIAFHPGTSQVSAVDMRGVIKSWDASDHQLVPAYPAIRAGRFYRLSFSPDGQYLATAGPGLAITLLRTNQGTKR